MKIVLKEIKKKPASWNEAEDRLLLLEWERGISVGEIATLHDRSDGAILSRLRKLETLRAVRGETPHPLSGDTPNPVPHAR